VPGPLPAAPSGPGVPAANPGSAGPDHPLVHRILTLALLAAAMGLQNAAARRLAVADMTTTVLTLTLTGIAADSRLAGGSDSRIARRGASVLLMLAGAAGGAALKAQGLGWPLTAGATLAVATTIWMASTPSESSPTKPSGTTITTDNPATTTST